MKKIFVVSLAAFVISLTLGFCANILGERDVEPTTVYTSVESAQEESEPGEISSVSRASSEKENLQEAAESNEIDVQKGKIISEFLSPYNASTSFGKIYLKNSTSQTIDIESELTQKLELSLDFSEQPEVLILHTHATEAYMREPRDYFTASDNPRSEDSSLNTLRVGEVMAQRLRENGIGVIHDTTLHDKESYTGSYDRSLDTAKEYLKKYPSIKVILDLHRDSISSGDDKVKAVCEVGGRDAAQIMIVLGCEDGSAPSHPNWRQNLRLGLRFQQALEIMYPGLARPISVVAHRYNQHLVKGAMLIEVGTEANSLDEAVYSAQLAGDTLARVLKNLEK